MIVTTHPPHRPAPDLPSRPSGPVVVMGISGSGKSTVGAALARHLDVPFADADDLHPPRNIEKMSAGEPLTDEDRWPWLDVVGEWLAGHPDGGVMSCSALRRAYRDRLRTWAPTVRFVHLDGEASLIADRQSARTDHFMPSSLLTSQQRALEALDPDEAGVRVDVAATVDAVVREVASDLDALPLTPSQNSSQTPTETQE